MSDSPQSTSSQGSKSERGKLGQRAYRRRHASKFQRLQADNLQLREIVRRLDVALLHRHGLVDDEVAALLCEARRLGNDEDGACLSEREASKQPRPSHPPSSSADWFRAGILESPNLDPVDVGPYIGAGMATLAGCIFWACITQSVAVFEESHLSVQEPPMSLHQADVSRRIPQADTNTPSVFGRSGIHLDCIFNPASKLADPRFLSSVALMRDHYRREGHVVRHRSSSRLLPWAVSPAEEPWPMRLGSTGDRPLNGPEEIADMIVGLRPRLSEIERFSELARRTDDDGGGSIVFSSRENDVALELGQLIVSLAQNFICAGVGPRWNAEYASMCIERWSRGVGPSREGLALEALS